MQQIRPSLPSHVANTNLRLSSTPVVPVPVLLNHAFISQVQLHAHFSSVYDYRCVSHGFGLSFLAVSSQLHNFHVVSRTKAATSHFSVT